MGQRLADLVENKMTYSGKTRPGDRLVLEWRLIETKGVVGCLRVNCRASSKVPLSWISAYGEIVVFIRVVGGPDMLGRDGETREVRRRWGRAGHDYAGDEKIVKA